jgi:hypothetical protein
MAGRSKEAKVCSAIEEEEEEDMVSWLAQKLLASQEGLSSMELVVS